MDDDTEVKHEKLGCSILYFILACITFLSLIFIHYFLPETKGQSHEKMMQLYSHTVTNGDEGLNGTNSNNSSTGNSNSNGSNGVNTMKEYAISRRYSNTSLTSLTNPLLARNDTDTVYVI